MFGKNCAGESINFTIYEDDLIGDDFITSEIVSGLSTTWVADYIEDVAGDPEYYFTASVVGDETEFVISGLLNVSLPEVVEPTGNYYYIRSDNDCVSKTCDGSNWDLAWNFFPTKLCSGRTYDCSVLERGATYYIADGSYLGIVFDYDEYYEGNEYITIKKAIESDHGTNTGWQAGYGDGQAKFLSRITISSNNIIFDGQIGSGSNPDSYGFRIPKSDCNTLTNNYAPMKLQSIHDPYGVLNAAVKHTAIENCGKGYFDSNGNTICQYGILVNRGYNENITIGSNYLSGGSSNMLTRNLHNSIIEGNYFTNQWSGSDCHGQQISPGGESHNVIFRGNTFTNSTVFVIGMHSDSTYDALNWQVYNNLIIGDNRSFSAVFANADSAYTDVWYNCSFHHNTFVNVDCGPRGAVFIGTLSDPENMKSYAYNNIFYNSDGCNMDDGVVSDYNYYFDSLDVSSSGENGLETTGDPFIDLANGDFRLKEGSLAIDAGKSDLGSPFNIDRDGVNRDAYAPWDIGAYEYVGGVVEPVTCDLTSASWNETSVLNGTLVSLTVFGKNCAGENVKIELWENDDLLGRDYIKDLNNVVMSSDSGNLTWTAEWIEDEGGITKDPEYVFRASLISDSTKQVWSNNELIVTLPALIVKPIQGLFAYYSFEGDMIDLAGNGNDGECISCPKYLETGGIGNSGAYGFNGINNTIRIPSNENQSISDYGTWNFWIKMGSYDSCQGFVSKRDSWNSNNAWAMGVDFASGIADELGFEYSIDGTGAQKSNNYYNRTHMALREWNMFTYVYNSSDTRNIRFYIDGIEIEPLQLQNINSPIYLADADIYIGSVNGGRSCHLNGILDELRIYNTVLSEKEINELYFLYQGCVDNDRDGWNSTAECNDGILVDCNDRDASIYPNAPELCDKKDNQCPGDKGYGYVDESCTCESFGGYTCVEGEICLGNQISNYEGCCDVECTESIYGTCDECGSSGLFDTCEPEECYSITEGCYFERSNYSCISCAEMTCDKYLNGYDCMERKCAEFNKDLIHCYWNKEIGVCTDDFDNDGVLNKLDNCFRIYNPAQEDSDNDRAGDACDKCSDTVVDGYEISIYGCILPNYTKFDFEDNFSTNLSVVEDLRKVENFTIGIREKARIMFRDKQFNLENVDLNRYIEIKEKEISVNTSALIVLNESAILQFYNVDYVIPITYRNGVLCDDCSEVSYSNREYVVSVPSFSTYTVEEGYVALSAPSGGSGGGGGGGTSLESVCIANWKCTPWSYCENGEKTRTCIDINNCNYLDSKPSEVESCVKNEFNTISLDDEKDEEKIILTKEQSKTLYYLSIVVIGFVIVIIIIMFLRKREDY